MTRTARDARERAKEYKADKEGEQPAAPPVAKPPRSEAEWRDVVSQAIEDAMRQGEFDNLRGRGKPLNLERNPFTPEGYDLAYEIMKNNNLAPAWLDARTEILREIERWRLRLRDLAGRLAAEAQRTAAPQQRDAFAKRLQAQRESLRAEVEALNRRIRDVNLQQPVVTMEVFMLRLDEELQRAGFPSATRGGG